MKVLLFILILSISAFAQTDLEKAKRVYWGVKEECEAVSFTSNELKNIKLECDGYLRDGTNIRTIRFNGVTFAVSIFYSRDYYYANVFVKNERKDRILIDPSNSIIAIRQTEKETEIPELLFPIPPEQIAAKIRSRANWANFFNALGSAFATTTTTLNSVNGSFNATIIAPNTAAQERARVENAARNQGAANAASGILESALKANTLFEGESVAGTVYFKHKKSLDGMLLLKMNDVYFAWEFYKKKGK